MAPRLAPARTHPQARQAPNGNTYGDPAGHSCLAVDGPAMRALTLRTGSDDRQANMLAFALAALGLLDVALDESLVAAGLNAE